MPHTQITVQERYEIRTLRKLGLSAAAIARSGGALWTQLRIVRKRHIPTPQHAWERGCNEYVNGLIRQVVNERSHWSM